MWWLPNWIEIRLRLLLSPSSKNSKQCPWPEYIIYIASCFDGASFLRRFFRCRMHAPKYLFARAFASRLTRKTRRRSDPEQVFILHKRVFGIYPLIAVSLTRSAHVSLHKHEVRIV